MENPQEETVNLQKTFEETGVYTTANPEDFKVIDAFYQAAPDVRIMQYMDRFFIQTKIANIMETYTDLGDEKNGVVSYQVANTLLMPKEGYTSLEVALNAVKLMQTAPTYTYIENTHSND
jgi:hypothetical protein